jgi:predicted secreted protein
MKRFLLALCLTLCATIAKAGDAASMDLIGFSKDGAYVAFEEFGIGDGSGLPYTTTNIVNVNRNALVAVIETRPEAEGATLSQARANAKPRVDAALRRYGILNGNQGRFTAATVPLNDPLMSPTSLLETEFIALARTYTVSLATKPAPDKPECQSPPQFLVLKLTVNGGVRDLQRDSRLPTARGCAYDYAVRSLHVYGRSLAVFVSYRRPGFEGPDLRWIVVTGSL